MVVNLFLLKLSCSGRLIATCGRSAILATTTGLLDRPGNEHVLALLATILYRTALGSFGLRLGLLHWFLNLCPISVHSSRYLSVKVFARKLAIIREVILR